jgi:uncharacterized protein YlxP (DUF503 family)
MLHIGVLQFTLDIPHATSLKDKRRVIKGMKDRLRRSFNVSLSETDDLDDCCTATLGAVMAGSDVAYINSALDNLINTLQDWRDASLADHQLEIFSPR